MSNQTFIAEKSTILRRMVVEALLKYNTAAGANVVELGDWPSDPESMPQILVYDSHSEQISNARTGPNFTATAFIMVDARVDNQVRSGAKREIDMLEAQIKQAVLCSQEIQSQLQQVSSIRTQKKMNSDTGAHAAQVIIEFGLEYFQSMDEYFPNIPPYIYEQAGVHADLTNVVDKTGTYSDPPFPDAVTPAPRTVGPDGRDEGFIQVDFADS